MKTKKPIIFLLAVSLLFAGNLQSTSAQNLDALSEYSIKLAISPSHLESGVAEHHVGYLYVLSKHGVPITSSYDVSISLNSDDPLIASVPEKITLKANEEFASFSVKTGEKSGSTIITASLNGKTTFQEIEIGTDETYLPDDLILELNLPTTEMHVNSEMPFSVYLKTSDGIIVRAPNDIEISLEHEKSLASPNSKTLIIKEGTYYAWGVLSAHERIGNTFLRAIHEESGLDIAKSIEISSTLPTALQLSIFPKLIPAEVDRTLDIFVTVVDSDGNPTKTPDDIPLDFFSSEQYPIGDALDDTVKSEKPMIKKGEFGYHFREKMNLAGFDEDEILVGASAEDLGIALAYFESVESLNIDNPIILDRALSLFVLPQMPSNTTAVMIYQLSAVGSGECIVLEIDENGVKQELEEDAVECPLGQDEEDKHSIEKIDKDELYPIQTNENFKADGLIDKINIISFVFVVFSVIQC